MTEVLLCEHQTVDTKRVTDALASLQRAHSIEASIDGTWITTREATEDARGDKILTSPLIIV